MLSAVGFGLIACNRNARGGMCAINGEYAGQCKNPLKLSVILFSSVIHLFALFTCVAADDKIAESAPPAVTVSKADEMKFKSSYPRTNKNKNTNQLAPKFYFRQQTLVREPTAGRPNASTPSRSRPTVEQRSPLTFFRA